MEPYVALMAALGALILTTAWLPLLLVRLPLTLPFVCVAIGAALFSIPGLPGPAPSPTAFPEIVERLTEFVVIVALTGAGLKLDRPLRGPAGRPTWRLLGIAMPLSIAALTLLGVELLGLGWATALLLAAALAPTDPVLASDVQVGPPGRGEEDEVRFTLTAEAGLNDGAAFPFVNVAMLIAAGSLAASEDAIGGPFGHPAADIVWKVVAGVVAGQVLGRGLGRLIFHLPKPAKLSRTGDGFIALGITFLVYGATEMIHGYGFLAVFVAALGVRDAERHHHFHEKMHDFIEQLEKLATAALLVLFGGALAAGGLLRHLTWEAVLFAAAALVVVRPATAWLSLIGTNPPRFERVVISFFGIRGVGTAYYLAHGFLQDDFERADEVWAAASLVILASILLHGALATPAMRRIDSRAATPPPGDDPAI